MDSDWASARDIAKAAAEATAQMGMGREVSDDRDYRDVPPVIQALNEMQENLEILHDMVQQVEKRLRPVIHHDMRLMDGGGEKEDPKNIDPRGEVNIRLNDYNGKLRARLIDLGAILDRLEV